MKTIGTLEEIGAQVGDVVKLKSSHDGSLVGAVATTGYNGDRLVAEDGNSTFYADRDRAFSRTWTIISRPAQSPIRTVTRKEIVPGIYGKVSIHQLRPDNGGYYIAMVDSMIDKERTVHSAMTEADLTAAIKTLTEIRDAMQNNALPSPPNLPYSNQ